MKLTVRDGALLLSVKVVPNSSRTSFAGMLGDAVKVKVAAPPEDGKANRAVERLIAGALEIAAGNVTVVGGHSSSMKTVRILGVAEDVVVEKLRTAMDRKL